MSAEGRRVRVLIERLRRVRRASCLEKVNGITKWIQNSVVDPAEGGDPKLIIIPISRVFNFLSSTSLLRRGE